jgi:hypothetical protein
MNRASALPAACAATDDVANSADAPSPLASQPAEPGQAEALRRLLDRAVRTRGARKLAPAGRIQARLRHANTPSRVMTCLAASQDVRCRYIVIVSREIGGDGA